MSTKAKPIEVGACKSCSHVAVCRLRGPRESITRYLELQGVNKLNSSFRCSFSCNHFVRREEE